MFKINLLSKRKTVNIICNGCSRRKLDSERIKNYFKKNNYRIIESNSNADYNVFVTCAFTQQREDESIKIIESLKGQRGELIVTGCLPEIAKENFKKTFNGRYLSTKNLNKFDDLFPSEGTQFKDIPDENIIPVSIPSLFSIIKVRSLFNKFSLNTLRLLKSELISKIKFKKYPEYYLRINSGCLGNCTYCGIKNAIGPLKSKPLNAVIDEFKIALETGYKIVNIISDDVGAYGIEIGESLPKLIKELLLISRSHDIKLKIKELHPVWLIKYRAELVDLVKSKKIVYILSGVQSGSDRILKLMKRHHSSTEITEVFKELKKANRNTQLSAQVIVGFPSETYNEFIETVSLLKVIKFDEVTIFPYTDRQGTKSSEIKEKISYEVIKDRVQTAVKLLKQANISCYADGLN